MSLVIQYSYTYILKFGREWESRLRHGYTTLCFLKCGMNYACIHSYLLCRRRGHVKMSVLYQKRVDSGSLACVKMSVKQGSANLVIFKRARFSDVSWE